MKCLWKFAQTFLLLPLSLAAEEIPISFDAVVDWPMIGVDECLDLEPGVTDTMFGGQMTGC